MGVQNSVVPLMMLLVVIAVVMFPSGNQSCRVLSESQRSSHDEEISFSYPTRAPSTSPSDSVMNGGDDPGIFRDSDRGVPGGPNPLHN
ncbi:hypothetical protein Scep_006581 [Stephania cephalantha]|uniref:Uncharacterized protein n=1 Tax=Stephania cephalantha TaxID=152367 RepID=A0AAP0K9T2_9MAGN